MNWDAFCKAAYALGFSEVGLCAADAFEEQKAQVTAQPAIAERRQLRFEPAKDNERTKSIAVLLYPYEPYCTEEREGEVFVDAYYEASNAAYHAAMELERQAQAAGRFVQANVPYPAKAAAVRAGLGIIGKNSLLITRNHGTRVVIILLATDYFAESRKQETTQRSCLDCGKCYQSCPSGALDEHGMRHPERCLRNFMMEGVVMPRHLRTANGMRLIGCDICQRVCPMQVAHSKRRAPDQFDLKELMTEDSAAFSSAVQRLSALIGRNAARPQRVRAQAALLAGISPNPAYLPVLEAWKTLPFEAVREHSQWAIEQIHAYMETKETQ